MYYVVFAIHSAAKALSMSYAGTYLYDNIV